MNIGARVRELRKEREWTQGKLAEAAGYTVPYLSDIERGRTAPSLKALQAIAKAFCVSLEAILSGVSVEPGTARRFIVRRGATVTGEGVIFSTGQCAIVTEQGMILPSIFDRAEIEKDGFEVVFLD